MSTTKTKSFPFDDIHPMAVHLVDKLSPYCHKIEIAGSLRRHQPYVHDIDLVAMPILTMNLLGEPQSAAPTPLDDFLHRHATRFESRGIKMQRFAYGKIFVDLYLCHDPNTYGSSLAIRTGSENFNKWLMYNKNNIQYQNNISISQNKIYSNGHFVPTADEKDYFKAFGLPYIPVRYRDNERWLEFVKMPRQLS